jgi:hypothetical protein
MWRKRGMKATGRERERGENERETRELSIHIRWSIQFFKQPVDLLHSIPPPFFTPTDPHPTRPLIKSIGEIHTSVDLIVIMILMSFNL